MSVKSIARSIVVTAVLNFLVAALALFVLKPLRARTMATAGNG